MYYQVTVKEQISDESSKCKNSVKLVDAVSVTDAEAKTHEKYKDYNLSWKVVKVEESKIDEIF